MSRVGDKRKSAAKAAPDAAVEPDTTLPAAIAMPPRRRSVAYRPSDCDAVVAFMGQGYSLTAFAGTLGLSRETMVRWRRKHRAFDAAVKAGEATRALALEQKLLAANSGASVSAHVFALKCAVPEEWRDKPAPGEEPGAPIKMELAIRFV